MYEVCLLHQEQPTCWLPQCRVFSRAAQTRPSPTVATTAQVEAADEVFWNKHLLRDMLEGPAPLKHWVLPVVQGFFGQRSVPVGPDATKDICNYILVSRRSRHRLGCRYKRRGVDMQVSDRSSDEVRDWKA